MQDSVLYQQRFGLSKAGSISKGRRDHDQ